MTEAEYRKLVATMGDGGLGVPHPKPKAKRGKKKASGRREGSSLERAFRTYWQQIAPAGMDPVSEHRFHGERQWRLDFAWPDAKVGVEIQGGTWMRKSGHNSGEGITRDCEKGNAAQELGWVVLHYTSDMLKNDPKGVIDQVVRVIDQRAGLPFADPEA